MRTVKKAEKSWGDAAKARDTRSLQAIKDDRGSTIPELLVLCFRAPAV